MFPRCQQALHCALRNRSFLTEQLEPRCLLTAASYTDRGWVSVIVDRTVASVLAPRLDRFKQTLIADGYTIAPDSQLPNVLSHSDAPRMDDENYVWNNAIPRHINKQFDAINGNKLTQYKSELAQVKAIISADWDAIPGPEENKK